MIEVSGNSRLSELKKPKPTNVFTEKYFGGGSLTSNGVDYGNSSPSNIVYYINGLKYTDKIDLNDGTVETIIKYSPTPSIPVVDNANIFKRYNIDGEYLQPKIASDVFVFRQEISPFKDNYLMEGVSNIEELLTFAGGRYFNIKENS